MKLSRRLFCFSVAAASAPPSHGKTKTNAATAITYHGFALGTRWHLTIDKSADAQPALQIVQHNLKMIDLSMSPYKPDSEVSLFNQPATTSQRLSAWCQPVVEASLAVAANSAGAFDPTVGPRVRRNGFGPITGSQHSTYSDLTLQNDVLSKKQPGTTIDLCGIAKGYALDKIAQDLIYSGYPDFMIELGGELRKHGNHPDNRPFQPGIATPAKQLLKLPFPVSQNAVATSGVSQQSYQFQGKRYSHLIEPKASRTLQSNVFSVSVFHRSAMFADAWSTALSVLDEQSALRCARRQNLDAVFILQDTSDYRVMTTGVISPASILRIAI